MLETDLMVLGVLPAALNQLAAQAVRALNRGLPFAEFLKTLDRFVNPP